MSLHFPPDRGSRDLSALREPDRSILIQAKWAMSSLLPQDLESAHAGCAPAGAVELCPAGASSHAEPQIGVVVIGRNEGERLRRCLESLSGALPNIVYVDSGSADGSVQMARTLRVHVLNLDLSRPFTAARARNAGFDELMKFAPNTDLVQFVDGDCEVVGDWLRTAGQFSWSHEALRDRLRSAARAISRAIHLQSAV